MILYCITAVVIVAAAAALTRVMRETNADRAETYPLDSSERRELETR